MQSPSGPPEGPSSELSSREVVATSSSRPVDEESDYFLKAARAEFLRSISRLEDTARYLLTAETAAGGLLLAVLKLGVGKIPQKLPALLPVVFALWALSMVAAILVTVPMKYEHYQNSPGSIREAFGRARTQKWWALLAAVLLFAVGLFLGAVSLATL